MTFPIVLAHGVCRFDQVWNKALDLDNCDDENKDRWHYFKGIRTMLLKKGHQVFHSKVSWAAGVDQRAEDLRVNLQAILQKTGAKKLNIIAHSMGGLDTRHMLFNDRRQGQIHKRIASLTTISTPHWGSPFADWGIHNLSYVIPIAGKIGLDLEAFKNLTVKECNRFNQMQTVIDFENDCAATIKFQTYAGRQNFWRVFGPLKLSFYIIEKKEGDNDGLVSVQSAKWQESYFKGVIEDADHFNELGWWDSGQLMGPENEAGLVKRIHAKYAEIAADLP